MSNRPDYLDIPSENSTMIFSPVTLNLSWPPIVRIIFLILGGCATFILNGCMLASFAVNPNLKDIGFMSVLGISISDLLTTSLMIIPSIVVIVKEWDILRVCHTMQWIGLTSTYSYSFYAAITACESYFRVCGNHLKYTTFLSVGNWVLSGIVFAYSIILGFLGTFLGLDYDYCQRSHYGNTLYKLITFILFHGLPFITSISCFVSATFHIRLQRKFQARNHRYKFYTRDLSTTHLNLAVFVIYVVSWIPYLVVVNVYPDADDKIYYYSIWFAFLRPVFSNLLYVLTVAEFKQAFFKILCYCLCKTAKACSEQQRVIYHDMKVQILQQITTERSSEQVPASEQEVTHL